VFTIRSQWRDPSVTSSRGVVDHIVGADRADQLDLGGGAHPGDLGAERLGQLDRERSHPPARPDDEHLLPGLDLAHIPQRLEGGEAGEGTAAACATERFDGFGAKWSSGAQAYSA
jgi:hypothetical protein